MNELFAKFIAALFPPRPTEQLVRLAEEKALMAHRTVRTIATGTWDGVALLPYRHPLVQAHVIEAKFYGSTRAQEALGIVLAEYVREHASLDNYTLVPIPLSKERRRQRGYNQVERICAAAAERLGTPAENILERLRDTVPQTSLSGDARRNNIRNAFRAVRELDANRTYIVVDDVTTTGATLLAACEALAAAGAKHLIPIALAY